MKKHANMIILCSLFGFGVGLLKLLYSHAMTGFNIESLATFLYEALLIPVCGALAGALMGLLISIVNKLVNGIMSVCNFAHSFRPYSLLILSIEVSILTAILIAVIYVNELYTINRATVTAMLLATTSATVAIIWTYLKLHNKTEYTNNS
jgi:hypothetical protein